MRALRSFGINAIASAQNRLTNFGAPAHLSIKSRGHLDHLLQEGCDSGDSIEVTDEWWAQKRERLFQAPP